MDFAIQKDHLIPARRPDLVIVNKKNNNKKKASTYHIGNFTVLTNHTVEIKESENRDKFLDLVREQRKLWNMVSMILNVIDKLVTVPKGLKRRLDELEIEGRIETIQTIAHVRSA